MSTTATAIATAAPRFRRLRFGVAAAAIVVTGLAGPSIAGAAPGPADLPIAAEAPGPVLPNPFEGPGDLTAPAPCPTHGGCGPTHPGPGLDPGLPLDGPGDTVPDPTDPTDPTDPGTGVQTGGDEDPVRTPDLRDRPVVATPTFTG